MIIIRPIEAKDLEVFEDIAQAAPIGVTNLPKNKSLLHKKLQNSLHSFSQEITKPKQETYVFVLENLINGEIGGTCSISSKNGIDSPHHFYRIESIFPSSTTLPVPKEIPIFKSVTYSKGPSEIRALFLKPNFRREGWGRLLSLSRFLFIANHPHRFDETITAEMCGYADKKNKPPFWEGFGRKFLDLDYTDLISLREKSREFIPDILPKWPIYITTLIPEVQAVIGKTHPDTLPALTLLQKEGFAFTNEIDVLDGGPKISARTQEIRCVSQSLIGEVKSIDYKPKDSDPIMILSNTRIDYRACYGRIKVLSDKKVELPQEIAGALKVETGEKIRFVLSIPPKGI